LPTFVEFMREATGRYLAFDGKLWKTLIPPAVGVPDFSGAPISPASASGSSVRRECS
jgi:hypothetical protein